MIVKLASEAGLPDGICNIMHGGKEAVEFLCTHPAIKAVGPICAFLPNVMNVEQPSI